LVALGLSRTGYWSAWSGGGVEGVSGGIMGL
jgi:hypothetical protein